jgi:hypothetical protein
MFHRLVPAHFKGWVCVVTCRTHFLMHTTCSVTPLHMGVCGDGGASFGVRSMVQCITDYLRASYD